MNEITKFANSFSKDNNTIQMYPARVISVDKDYSKATVELISDINSELTLLNKTGERLIVGDSVWVFYKNNINSGWIGLKNGKSNINDVTLKICKTQEEYDNIRPHSNHILYIVYVNNDKIDIHLGDIKINIGDGGTSKVGVPVNTSVYTQTLQGYVSSVTKEEI